VAGFLLAARNDAFCMSLRMDFATVYQVRRRAGRVKKKRS